MHYQPKILLVTGGAGFIGSHFILWLLKFHPEYVVINVDKLTYAASLDYLDSIQSNNYHFVKGDIGDAVLIEKILRDYNVDTIVHFAAESHVDRSIATPNIFLETNVLGTFTLLESAKKVWLTEKKWNAQNCRFHHISTDEVYGTLNKTDPAFSETTAYAPNSPYSASKASSDHLVRAYFHTYNLPTTLSNCSNNYGPHQHDEKLIPTVIRHCLAEKPIPIYGDGSNIRDWLYVEDHCAAIDLILHQSPIGETYNIGGNAECSNLELVKLICSMLDDFAPSSKNYENLISFVTDRPGHDWRYAINCKKIEEKLNWKRTHTLVQGMEKTIMWYLGSRTERYL